MGSAGWRPGRTEAWLPGSPPCDGQAQAISYLRTHGQTLLQGHCHPQWGSLILDSPARCPVKEGMPQRAGWGSSEPASKKFAAFCCSIWPVGPRAPWRGLSVSPCQLSVSRSLMNMRSLSLPSVLLSGLILVVFGSVKSPLPPFIAAIMKKHAPFTLTGPQQHYRDTDPLLQIINLVPYCITS